MPHKIIRPKNSKVNVSLQYPLGVSDRDKNEFWYGLEHKGTGEYLVKIISGKNYSDQDKKLNIDNEAKAMRIFNHQNVIKYVGAFKTKHNYYIVYAYNKNVITLRNYLLKNKLLKEQEALKIIKQVVSGFHFIHTCKHILPLISPELILLIPTTTPGEFDVKIGMISYIFEEESVDENTTTIGNEARFQDFYSSPEALSGKEISYKSGVWSIGEIYYEMLMGAHPFPADNYDKIHQLILNANLNQSLASFPMTQKAKEFIKGCLQLDEKTRPRTEDLLMKDSSYLNCTTEAVSEELLHESNLFS